MTRTEKYSKTHLLQELHEIENSNRNIELPILTLYEKSLIYKYSSDGYININEELRTSEGKAINSYGKLLVKALSKLPNYEGIVYRGANLAKNELERYKKALKTNTPITEYSFVSTSKARLIAMAFNGNCLFRIVSKSGKEIDKIAKFGVHGHPDEKEVLFNPNCEFEILAITNETTYTLITMEEL
jgi:ADP-ribosyltransferase exoenzyme